MISSNSNQQIKRIVQLQKKAKTRWEQRVFVVEGPKMVLEAPLDWLESVYVSESFLQSSPYKQQISEMKCGYEVVSDSVMRSVSDTKTPQGILALVKMPAYGWEDIVPAQKPPHILILESIQDPGNLGTMLRTGEGAGISGILMNNTTADLYNPKTIRATMGSIYRVPCYVSGDLGESVLRLKAAGVSVYAAHLKGTTAYDEPDYTKGSAFLVGNEGNGLTDELAALTDAYIRIPMEGQVESLNAAIAATLLMYEVNRQRRIGCKNK